MGDRLGTLRAVGFCFCSNLRFSLEAIDLFYIVRACKRQFPAPTRELPAPELELSASGRELSAPERELSVLERELSALKRELSAPARELSAPELELSAPELELSASERELSAPVRELFALERQLSAPERQLLVGGKPVFAPERQLSAPRRDGPFLAAIDLIYKLLTSPFSSHLETLAQICLKLSKIKMFIKKKRKTNWGWKFSRIGTLTRVFSRMRNDE